MPASCVLFPVFVTVLRSRAAGEQLAGFNQTKQILSAASYRDVYNPSELLGGSSHAFMVGNMEASRIDYELVRVCNAVQQQHRQQQEQ
jgi:hypothetical protein